MSQALTLSELVARLATVAEWEMARGPRHPTEPSRDLAPEIEHFLASYPFLRRDAGYVDFLEQYAGAHLVDPDDTVAVELPDRSYRVVADSVEIFGFSHTVSLHIVDGDGEGDNLPIVDTDGFLQVASLNVTLYKLDDLLPGGSMLFGDKSIAFDATGKRPWGVYAKTDGPAGSGPVAHWSMLTYQRCWDTFLDFLADLVTGDVLYPPHPLR